MGANVEAAMELLSASEEGSPLVLVESDGRLSHPRWQRPFALLGSAFAASVAAAFFLHRSSGIAAAATAEAQQLSMYSTNIESISCYAYTGQSCSLQECDASMGAVCRSGRCICEVGCAGVDSTCHVGSLNEPVATAFTLTNLALPQYSMYFQGVSVLGQIKTTEESSWENFGKDKFNLHRLPGLANETRFFLGSFAYPSQVARITPTPGDRIDGHDLYATDLSQGKSPARLSVLICWEGGKSAMRIGDIVGEYWAYIEGSDDKVYGYREDRCKTGDGFLWVPFPAFSPAQINLLPECGC